MAEIDRIYHYRALFTGRRMVTRDEILRKLEISPATFKRDLAKLRDRLNIPVVYDKDLGGYRLEQSDSREELPGLWFSQEEMLALLTIQHMIAQLEPGVLGPKLKPLQSRLNEMLASQGVDAQVLAQRVKLVHAGKRKLTLKRFEAVTQATLNRKKIKIQHYNRQNGETVERTISPQQLVYYRDNWYVDAWCHLRKGLRNFSIDAIKECDILDEAAKEIPQAQIQAEVTAGYGIFSGQDVQWARMAFTPGRARWVSREEWHPDQKATFGKDGSYALEVPFSDERELLGDILKHGPEVVVLGPPRLRESVQKAIRLALNKYESYN
ncbi:MAG: helix-turn-helix transcriptional regulator [Hylemonella sp.]